jgi:DNA-binding GntR family transcriptional regulator
MKAQWILYIDSKGGLKMAEAPTIKRQTVAASVADILRRRIVNGEYAGGDQIRQEAVAAELSVSRIPVREALLQLESEGLVNIHTHRGAMVVDLTRDDAIDLFEARLIFEPALLALGVAAATPSDLAALKASLADYTKAVKTGAEPDVLSQLNWAFHTAMCRPSKRPRMLAALQSLYTGADRYLRLQILRPQAKRRALEDHQALYQAYSDKNAPLAEKLIRDHIRNAYKDVLESLGGENPKQAPSGDAGRKRSVAAA